MESRVWVPKLLTSLSFQSWIALLEETYSMIGHIIFIKAYHTVQNMCLFTFISMWSFSSFILIIQIIPGLGSLLRMLVLVQPVRAVDQGLEPLEALLIDRMNRHGVVLHLRLVLELLLAERTVDRIVALIVRIVWKGIEKC